MKTVLPVEKTFGLQVSDVVLYGKLILTAIFWGGTFVAGRTIANQVDPFCAAFLRFAVASLFLAAFLWRSRSTLPKMAAKDALFVVLLGLTGVFAYNVFFFSGLQTVTASRASLIIASNPAFIALFSCLFFQERLDLLKVFGIGLSMTGAVVVITHGNLLSVIHGGLGWGELCIFGSVISWVLYSLIGKATLKRLTPLIAVTYSCVVGAACLLGPALMRGLAEQISHYSEVVWLGVLYLGFFGSALGFIWYYQGIRAIGAARAAVFINFVPVSGVILAYLILGESLSGSLLMGALLVVAGVYCTNRPR